MKKSRQSPKQKSDDLQTYLSVGVVFLAVGVGMMFSNIELMMGLPFIVLGVTFLILSQEKSTKKPGK